MPDTKQNPLPPEARVELAIRHGLTITHMGEVGRLPDQHPYWMARKEGLDHAGALARARKADSSTWKSKIDNFIEKTPNWVRWLCIIPGLVVANICWLGFLDLMQLISMVGYYFGGTIYLTETLKHFIIEFGKPIIAVLTVMYIAPKGKFVLGLIVGIPVFLMATAAIVAGLVSFFTAIGGFDESAWVLFFTLDFLDEPFWYIFLESVVGVLGALIAIIYVFIFCRKTADERMNMIQAE